METTILTPHSAGDHGRQGLPPRQERHGDHELPGDRERHELSGAHGIHEDQERQGDHGAPSGLSRAAAAAQERAENLNSAAAAPPGTPGAHGHPAGQEDPGAHGLHDPPGDHERHELSIPEAALAVGLSISTIRRLIQNGRLPARYERGDKGQNRYFIARADLAPLAALGTNPAVEAMGTPAERLSTHGLQTAPDPERMSAQGRQGDPSAVPMSRHGLHEGAASLETMDTHAAPMSTHPPPAARPEGAPGPHGDPAAAAAAPAGGEGRDAGPVGAPGAPPETLEHQAAYLELAVLRERLAGAQEAVRLHAERVRGQAKDIGFLQAQLDRSREAEEQLRVLLARLTAALPAPAEPPALAARNLEPSPPARRVRWWQSWRRGA